MGRWPATARARTHNNNKTGTARATARDVPIAAGFVACCVATATMTLSPNSGAERKTQNTSYATSSPSARAHTRSDGARTT